MSCSVPVDNNKKDTLILGEGPTPGLDGTTLTVEKCVQLILLHINFIENNKKFCINKNNEKACIIMEQTVVYLLMVHKFINLRQKILKLWQLHYV